MLAERRTITQDHYDAVCWLAGLGNVAFRAVEPQLSHDLLYTAVLVSLSEPIPADYFATIQVAAVDFELSGPARRCYGFLAAVVEHLCLVEPAPKQLSLFPGDPQ